MRPLARLAIASAAAWLAACADPVASGLEEARKLQQEGQFQASIAPLQAVLEAAPDQPEANHRIGVAYVQTGQQQRALAPLTRAAAAPEYAVPSGLLLASTALAVKSFDDALYAANRVLEVDPERGAALAVRARAQLAAGRPEEALRDVDALLARTPDDFRGRLLRAELLARLERTDEAEQALRALRDQTAAAGGAPAARACVALATFLRRDRRERAEAVVGECLAAFPADPAVLRIAADLYDASGREAEATEAWQRAVREAPGRLGLRILLAHRLATRGAPDAAREVLDAITRDFDTAEGWQAVAGFHARRGDTAPAIAALEQALRRPDAEREPLTVALADLHVTRGELDAAEALLATLSEPRYQDRLRGHLLLARGEPQQALGALERTLAVWPDDPRSHELAGHAALALGQVGRAVAEYRNAVEADPAATDAALALARLYLAQGEPRLAAELAREYVRHHGATGPEAFLVGVRAATALGEFDAARKSLDNLERLEGTSREILLERAAVERAAVGPAQAARVVAEGGFELDREENTVLLATLVNDLVAAGMAAEARGRVDAALARSPGSAGFLVLDGALRLQAGELDAARGVFERARAADPGNAQAIAGLATLSGREGDVDRAVALYDEAAGADPGNGQYAYAAARVLLAAGRTDDAEARLRAAVTRHAELTGARNDLAWLLAERGKDLDLALALARQAERLDPRPTVLDTLGYVHLARGELREAVQAFELALAREPGAPTPRYHLALALARAGETERARSLLREALAVGPFPEAQAARAELARLESP